MKARFFNIALYLLLFFSGTSAAVYAEGFEAAENFRSAMTAFKEKSFYSARLLLQEIVLKDARGEFGDDAQYYLAMSYYYEGDYKTAQFEFRVLERDFPESPFVVRAAFWNGEAWFYRKSYRESIESHAKFIRKYRENILAASALYTIGYIYNEQKRYDEAVHEFARALKEYPETTAAPALTLQLGIAHFNSGEYVAARRAFETLMVKFAAADNLDAARFWLGKSYYAENKYDSALKEFSALTKDFPESPQAGEALYLAALCKYKSGALVDALALLDETIRNHPKSSVYPFARLRQAQLMSEQGNLALTLTPLLDIINNFRSHETFAPALDLMAEVRRKQGKADEAIATFEALKTEKNVTGRVRKELLRRYADLLYQESRFTAASEVYTELLHETGEEAEGATHYLLLARSQYKDGKFEAALASLVHLEKKFDDEQIRAETVFLKAEISYALGKFTESLQLYARLIKKYPGHSKVFEAEMGIGWAYFELKQYARAADNFRKILKKYKKPGDQAKTLLALGAAQYNLRDLSGALASYQRVVTAFTAEKPEAAEAQYQIAWLKFRRGAFADAEREFRVYINSGAPGRLQEARYFAALSLFQLADYKRAESELSEVYIGSATPAWLKEKALIDLAKTRMAIKDWLSSRDTYRRLVEEFPESAVRDEASYQIIALSFRVEDEKSALAGLALLGEKGKNSLWYIESLRETADYYRRKRDFTQADAYLAQMENAQKKPAEKLEVQASRAALLVEQGKDNEALQLLEKILKSEELSEATTIKAGGLLFQILEKSGKLSEGETWAHKLAERFAENAKLGDEMLLFEAKFLYLGKKTQASRDILTVLIKSREVGGRARFMLAESYQTEGDLARALDYFRQIAQKQDPATWLKARFYIGEILYAKEEFEEAAREFSRIAYAESRDDAVFEKSLYRAALCFRHIKKDKEFETFKNKLKEAFPRSIYLKELE